MRRSHCALFLLPFMLVAASCASRKPIGGPCPPPAPQARDGQSPSASFGLAENTPSLERRWPAREQVFRHAVRIDFPGIHPSFSFDGIMRLRNGATGPEIRVVCLGTLGLTLCDMTITPDEYRADLLHPSLAKVPHVAKHIALCVKSIWFASLPLAEQGKKVEVRREIHGRTLLEHMVEKDGRYVVRALGPDAFWTVGYMPDAPQPLRITFHNDREGYTVTIRFVAG